MEKEYNLDEHTYTPDLRGLVPKYRVYYCEEDGSRGDLVESQTFTLRPEDPHARVALRAYAQSVMDSNPVLGEEINSWVQKYDRE